MSDGLRIIDVKLGSHIEMEDLEYLREFGLAIRDIRGEVERSESQTRSTVDVYHIIVRCQDKEGERISIVQPSFVPPIIDRDLLEQYLKGGEK